MAAGIIGRLDRNSVKHDQKPSLLQMLHMHVDIESGQAKILANNKEANMKRVIPLERIMFRIGLIILLSKLYVCLCWPAIDL